MIAKKNNSISSKGIRVYPRLNLRVSAIKMFSTTTLVLTLVISAFGASNVLAEEKVWNSGGDGIYWADGSNWFMQGKPTDEDDVVIDSEDAAVIADETYNAQSLSIGGKENSQFTTKNFVYGTIAPPSANDISVENRSGGIMTIQGSAGRIILKGTYLDNEEIVIGEPSFMFWVK